MQRWNFDSGNCHLYLSLTFTRCLKLWNPPKALREQVAYKSIPSFLLWDNLDYIVHQYGLWFKVCPVKDACTMDHTLKVSNCQRGVGMGRGQRVVGIHIVSYTENNKCDAQTYNTTVSTYHSKMEVHETTNFHVVEFSRQGVSLHRSQNYSMPVDTLIHVRFSVLTYHWTDLHMGNPRCCYTCLPWHLNTYRDQDTRLSIKTLGPVPKKQFFT